MSINNNGNGNGNADLRRLSVIIGMVIAVLFHFGWAVWFSASMNAKVSFLLTQSNMTSTEMQRRNALLMDMMADTRALTVRIDSLERERVLDKNNK